MFESFQLATTIYNRTPHTGLRSFAKAKNPTLQTPFGLYFDKKSHYAKTEDSQQQRLSQLSIKKL